MRGYNVSHLCLTVLAMGADQQPEVGRLGIRNVGSELKVCSSYYTAPRDFVNACLGDHALVASDGAKFARLEDRG